jgi:hypothetical protein
MKATSSLPDIDRFCAVIGLAFALANASAASSSDFERLLANPQAFDGKRVTLTGVASIGGAEFYLYPNEDEARKAGTAVFVNRNLEGPRYDKFSDHWLKITGIVNAERHGPFNNDPCEIWLEHFEVLRKASVRHRNIYGVFRNDTSSLVNITIYRPDGYSNFGMPPRETSTEGITKEDRAVVTTATGKLIAKSNLVPLGTSSRYFDSAHHSYYYRITDTKIEMVPVAETSGWNVYRPE